MESLNLPEFLSDKSLEAIHSKMLSELPDNLDKSQGQHVYNLTRPTAVIASELCQQTLPNIIRLIFPMWAYGEWLDCHAYVRGLARRPAAAASGKLALAVEPGTVIPSGAGFSTASVDGEPAVTFKSTETVIASGDNVEVPVECTKPGVTGNVIAHTVVFKLSKLDGIKAVDNPLPITGGTEEEDDESLRERILELDSAKSISYVGSVSDYKRWSKEVVGVGEVTVIPAQDDSGLVTLVITDGNGDPANENLCKAVYNHIMSPEDPEMRLTAPNVKLLVLPPESLGVQVEAVVEMLADSSLEAIKSAFMRTVQAYLDTARADGEIRYTQLGRLLAETEGVYDYADLMINGGTENIPLTATQLPRLADEDVRLTRGVVD